MGVTTNSKMKKANLVDLIYKNFKDHFKVMLKYILTVELKGNDNYHCYHSLTKLWVYKKPLTFVCKIILQKQNTENLFQISPSRITFLSNTDRGRRRPLAEVFVRQGFGDEWTFLQKHKVCFLCVKVSEMNKPLYKGTKSGANEQSSKHNTHHFNSKTVKRGVPYSSLRAPGSYS